MASKHYDTSYLEDTEKFLVDFKKSTYEPFAGGMQGTVLEIGCGNGDDAIRLAQINPELKVVGLDHDPELVRIAAEKASAMGVGVEFQATEVERLSQLGLSADGIRTERLFQHLKEPFKAIQDMYNLLNPGGKFLTVETDWAGLNIYIDSWSAQKKFVQFLVEEKVNNGMASRILPTDMRDVGFKNVTYRVVPFIIHNLATANALIKFQETVMEASQKGYLSEDEQLDLVNKSKELDASGMFHIQMNMIIVEGVK